MPIGAISNATSEFTSFDGTVTPVNMATACANAAVIANKAQGGVLGMAGAMNIPGLGHNCLPGGPLNGLVVLAGWSTKNSVIQYVEDTCWGSASTRRSRTSSTVRRSRVNWRSRRICRSRSRIPNPESNANSLDQLKLSQTDAWLQRPGDATADLNALSAYLNSISAEPILTDCRSLAAPGANTPGYDREAVLTGQSSVISVLSTQNPVPSALGADLIPLVFSAGFQYLPELGDHQNDLALPRTGNYHDQPLVNWTLGSGVTCGSQALAKALAPVASGNKSAGAQYVTSFSWGYRLVVPAQYNNAFGTAWTVTPSVQWAHDVGGYSAGPTGSGFIEGSKTITLGVAGSPQNTWNASVNWTSSFGNRFQNFMYDKDFAQFNVSYAF
ncbi:DUF1302 family protein [Parvibaculum sedimenti]|uniref:DUF1302 family protein n=1 Tax=Parvibaculum sedimenti TaxID=2608632 RepID=A0A6N6VIU6_9HYPH|nr:DUF1302 family protein [Parvibaculum sedimenti]KAB7740392.1 DUF1302 family protein [Parvibaculum sedimenti]